MHRLMLISLLLLVSCGGAKTTACYVPADLLTPAPGWTGATPATQGMLIDAAAAEMRGREIANAQLRAVAEIVGPQ